MDLKTAWALMEAGERGIYKGKEYYVSMGVLLRPPHGQIAMFRKGMINGPWEIKKEARITNEPLRSNEGDTKSICNK